MKQTQMTAILIIFFAIMIANPVFAQNGVIRELAGTVEIKRSGAANFVPARVGDIITQDAVVSTGFRSSALIQVGSTLLTVRPVTRLTLAELSAAAGIETVNVNLQAGRVRVDATPPAGSRINLELRGPVVTASTRGTGFEFDTRILTVHEGVVAFKSRRGGVILVSAGSTSQVGEDDRIVSPIETNAAELLPPPPVGSDTGFNRSESADDPYILYGLDMILH